MKAWRFLLIGMLLTGCTGALSATPEPTLPPVKADADVIAVEGAVEPAQWVTLRAGESTRVAEVLAAEGDGVRAGDALLRLDDADARLAVQQAEAALAGARAQLDLAQPGRARSKLAALEAQIAVADAASPRPLRCWPWRGSAGQRRTRRTRRPPSPPPTTLPQATEGHDDTLKCFDIPRPTVERRKSPALGTYEELTRAQMEAAQAALAAAQAQTGCAARAICRDHCGGAGRRTRRRPGDAAQAQLDSSAFRRDG
jgi:multidrug efflux pump subunit AcrA (membrane-fusion protein)